MKITSVRTFPITLAVRPESYIVSTAGPHAVSRYVLVAVETDSGMTGWGEATVVPNWSGETRAGADELIRDHFAPALIGRDPADVEAIAGEIDALVIGNSFTKAAVEMAVLDLHAQRRGVPLYELLGGATKPLEIPIKFSIGLREPEDAAGIALTTVRRGITAIKVKVGPDTERDLARVRAVRAAVGPGVKLNVDVNGGWTAERSVREIPRYLPLGLEYVEQPTPRWDIDALAEVRAMRLGLPIMADESVFTVWDARQVIRKHAADLISIYPGKNGGILRSMEICRLAADAGIACHLGSNLEWDVGTAAMCHVAAACANVASDRFPVDILGPLYYTVRPNRTPIRYENGRVHVPSGAGLGVSLGDDELKELTSDRNE